MLGLYLTCLGVLLLLTATMMDVLLIPRVPYQPPYVPRHGHNNDAGLAILEPEFCPSLGPGWTLYMGGRADYTPVRLR